MKNQKLFAQASVLIVLFSLPSLMGMAMVGVKQLSRTINEETVKAIKPCETTDKELFKLLRKPTDDYTAKQGDYTVYTYYGFSGRGGTKKQKLDVLMNKENVVVNYQLNGDAEPMQDKCIS